MAVLTRDGGRLKAGHGWRVLETTGEGLALTKTGCGLCRVLRTVLAAALLGLGAGWGAHWLGAGGEVSMLATFVGAILPVLWYQRRTRADNGDMA